GGRGLLAGGAAGRLAARHQALDTHPRRRAADYLRHMLTASAVLPPRDGNLARTEQWAAALLESIGHPADRRLIQAYATWQVIRRLRASTGRNRRGHTAHARNNTRAAGSWLAGRRAGGASWPTCQQADIDKWLGTGPGACQARDFVSWAAARGHCPNLDIPAPARRDGTSTTQDQRW